MDEYRYHEALIHPAMALHGDAEEVLILGGGDGLAAREVFKYTQIQSVTLVELDSRVTELAAQHPEFRKINNDALRRSHIRIIIADAFIWIRKTDRKFDVIVADFPDPHAPVLARLYSHEFYLAVKERLKPGGVFVTQSSSPYFARRAYWSIHRTLESTGFETASFHTYIQSFCDWGFHLATEKKIDPQSLKIDVPTRFLSNELLTVMFVFGKDVSPIPADINTLNNMNVYAYYRMGDWEEY
jgi:spermidine synthase